ncbi:murein biosynthesis integral membrane protein MurJ [Actinomadura miaoliensis]|uniref:Lipid II flippase MurJ n=1 Tax=Actinomadura miaoliensis TaxID=430685 RepID=A0ABP7WMT7_9ACTN
MTAVDAAPARGVSVGRATAVSGLLIGTGTVLGFLRDLTMAHQFGATSGTDAFLVGWTIPETVSPLLIEDAMALAVVPAISHALHRHGGVRPLVAAALPRLTALLALTALLTAVAAPYLVSVLAPGLSDATDAVRCVRLTSLTILTFGIAGFMGATLRAHHCFGPPAAIYAAYNVGILAMIGAFHEPLGVTSAALGVAFGSLLMVAVVAPIFARCVTPARASARTERGEAGSRAAFVGLAALAPIVIWSLTRQAQTLVERFLGSSLAEGSISYLNYAQKVAQVPTMLSLLLVTVTFPRLARASADGDLGQIRRRMEMDVVGVGAMVLCATAFLIAFAPSVISILFQHGRFTKDDTDTTALIMRVYSLGLLGQAMVGVAGRGFFAHRTPRWYPVLCVAIGLVVTAIVGVATLGVFGVGGLAAANALGISVAAVLLFVGLRSRVAPLSLRRTGKDLVTLLFAAVLATAVGCLLQEGLAKEMPPVLLLALGGVVLLAVFGTALLVACAYRGFTTPARGAATGEGTSPLEFYFPFVVRATSRVVSRFDRGGVR